MAGYSYAFFTRLARILNSEQSRSIILSGNVYDLFDSGTQYVPLIPFLVEKTRARGLIRVVYELNGPVRVLDEPEKVKNAWIAWKSGSDPDTLLLRGLRERGKSEFERLGDQFDQLLLDAIGNPTLALELLRQLTVCSRSGCLQEHLLILIEAADMLLPAGSGDVASLGDRQLHRISIVQDWFGDPAFMNGHDSVCLIAESRSLVHPRVARLPQVLSVEIPSPAAADRLHFIEQFLAASPRKPQLWGSPDELAALTAGLSIHAVRQLLLGAAYGDEPLRPGDVVGKVEEFIQAQLGEDVIEFKKPSHTLDAVVGFSKLKQFLRDELLPRFRAPADRALPGGGGRADRRRKTFILKRSPPSGHARAGAQKYPQPVVRPDRRDLERAGRSKRWKSGDLVDEADTQFGGVGNRTRPSGV